MLSMSKLGGAALLALAFSVHGGVPASFRLPDSKVALQNLVKNFRQVEVNPARLVKSLETFQRGDFTLDLGADLRWDLELERTSIRASNYAVRLITPDGIQTVEPTPENAFKGRIRGYPASKVRLSVGETGIVAFLDAGDGNAAYIEPMAHFGSDALSSSHAVYREQDVLPTDAQCGLADPVEGSVVETHAIEASSLPAAPTAQACALTELAVALDYSMVTGYGSRAAAEKRINDIYLLVDEMYRDPRIEIAYKISEVFVETSDLNTWGTSTDMGTLLSRFNTWARGGNFQNKYDVPAMWWYQRSGGVVGIANLGVICNGNGNVIKDFTNTIRSIKIDAAHELGHNWSSGHFNGNTLLMNPAITGVNDQWSTDIINRVVSHKNSRTCLSSCTPTPILPQVMPALPGSGVKITAIPGGHRVGGLVEQAGRLEVVLKDAKGAEVLRKTQAHGSGWFSADLDTKALAANVYLLEIRNGNKVVLKGMLGK